jgi:hypothetical protein
MLLSASIIRVTRISEVGKLAVTTLMTDALSASETSVLTSTTWRNISEGKVLERMVASFTRIQSPLNFLLNPFFDLLLSFQNT